MIVVKFTPHFKPFIGKVWSFGDRNKEPDLFVIRGFFIGIYRPISESDFSRVTKAYMCKDFDYVRSVRIARKKEISKARAYYERMTSKDIEMYKSMWESELKSNRKLKRDNEELTNTIRWIKLIHQGE